MFKIRTKSLISNGFLFISSLLIVTFGTPALSGSLSLFAALFGWVGIFFLLLRFSKASHKFLIGGLWYFCMHSIQMSWLICLKYHGLYIVFVYLALTMLCSLQFACLSLLINKKFFQKPLALACLASLWTFCEWSRLFIFSGYVWQPAGLSFTANKYTLQLASICGIYGLSFLSIFINLVATKAIFFRCKKAFFYSISYISLSIILGIILYLRPTKELNPVNVALVQTGYSIEEKVPMAFALDKYIHPYKQWQKIIQDMQNFQDKNIHLWVFPEACLPFVLQDNIYEFDVIKQLLINSFGKKALDDLPPEKDHRISNAYIMQWMSNITNSDIIVGTDSIENKKTYNSAAFFQPFNKKIRFYHKHKLMPLAEYLPSEKFRNLAKRYGVVQFFTPGKAYPIFNSSLNIAPNICYDELFGHSIRKGKLKGAQILVNLTNDGWYGISKLPLQHFYHGRVRAVENGSYLLRVCSAGKTCIINAKGQTVKHVPIVNKGEWHRDILFSHLCPSESKTFYLYWGDYFILCVCALFLVAFFLIHFGKKLHKA